MFSRDDRYCPIAKKEITEAVCYEMVMSMSGVLHPSAIPEVRFINDEKTRMICDACPYSDLS